MRLSPKNGIFHVYVVNGIPIQIEYHMSLEDEKFQLSIILRKEDADLYECYVHVQYRWVHFKGAMWEILTIFATNFSKKIFCECVFRMKDATEEMFAAFDLVFFVVHYS